MDKGGGFTSFSAMISSKKISRFAAVLALASCGTLWAADAPPTGAPPGAMPASVLPPKPDFPPSSEVLKDYQEVISTMEKTNSLFSVWVRRKDNQVMADSGWIIMADSAAMSA